MESTTNELIDEILKIDNLAQEKLNEQKKIENESLQKLKIKKQQILNTLTQKAEEHMLKLQKFKKTEFDEQLHCLEQEKNRTIKTLDTIYDNNKNNWIDEIISNTLAL